MMLFRNFLPTKFGRVDKSCLDYVFLGCYCSFFYDNHKGTEDTEERKESLGTDSLTFIQVMF